ncbi:glycosyltransferase [Thiothrix subterranea]|uniref:Glycosyltransferase n=1 Tax=Thiothrix subterranea TaxID=2735563 RepID=A0AA51MP32_9GAMM|nr:glycosyltransferase [Thiothrix subterranea]MDQ5770305.1 glycosyltransferase [Thiothrix subterranea]WML85847.1 glycosyltransferase [Thiothrix subterranea]
MKISFITTTYNSLETLKECIKSVSECSIKDMEHIVADDGSTDRTIEYIKNLNSFNIKLISCGRVGRANALNIAIEKAKGDFICILDSDDLVIPDNFGLFIDFIVRKDMLENYDVFYGNIVINGINKNSPTKKNHSENQINYRELNKKTLLFYNRIPNVCALIKKKSAHDVGYYNNKRVSQIDFDLWLRMVINNNKFLKIEIPIGIKRLHENQFFERKNHFKYTFSGVSLAINFACTKYNKCLCIASCFVGGLRLVWSILPRSLRVTLRTYGKL